MKQDLSKVIVALPRKKVQFGATKRAMKEFGKLDPSIATIFTRLLQRIADDTNNGGWKKLSCRQADVFGVESLFEARANKKYRLFATFVADTIILLGFGHRGEKEHFRHEY